MARGRKALPDEIKALKGNPGKRKLNLQTADAAEARKIEQPKFLKGESERAIFKRVSEELNRIRFIKHTDIDVLGRWAYYMHKWVSLKQRVDAKNADVYYETASKHGTMLRTHPLFASLLQIERTLIALEDRLGLNPSSRQTVLRGVIGSGPPQADLFPKPANPAEATVPSAGDKPATLKSPLAFLQ